MKYEIERKQGEVKITFDLNHSEWDEHVNSVYLKTKGKFNIPGFRKGHATRKMIENVYGAGVFFDDAFNEAFRQSYIKMLDENEDIYPVDEPKVDISKFDDKGLTFTAEVTVKPEVKLGQYTGIKLEKVEYNVTDEEIDAEIDKARNRLARTIEIKDRALEKGDRAKIDYSGAVNGEKFNGGTASGYQLEIGSNTFIPGFEDQLIGMQIGETKDITVKFPEEYHADELKGKDAVFTVTLHEITRKELPELNDEFAQQASKFDVFADYKADIIKTLEQNAKNRAKIEEENRVIKAVTDNAEVEIPDCMIESQLDYIAEDFGYRLSYAYGGMKLEDYLKYTGSTMEEFRAERRSEAKDNVKTRLVLEAVIKAEGIEATDEEAKAKAEERGVDESKMAYIKNEIITEKTLSFLTTHNVFEKAKATKSKAKSEKAVSEETAEDTEKPAAKKPAAKKSTKKADTSGDKKGE